MNGKSCKMNLFNFEITFPNLSLIDSKYSRADLHAARFRTGSNEFTSHSFDVQWPRLKWPVRGHGHFRPTPSGGLTEKHGVPEPISCGMRTLIRALCWNYGFKEVEIPDREILKQEKRMECNRISNSTKKNLNLISFKSRHKTIRIWTR